MDVILNKPNPKALNLTGLDSQSKKVTVGFKCPPKIKLKLAQEAKKVGITLSELVENYVMDIESAKGSDSKEIEGYKAKLAFYENDILGDLLSRYKGEVISIKNANGNLIKVEIKDLNSVYTVLINSFKPSK